MKVFLQNFVEKSEEYILKSTFDIKQQELNFKNFINLFCQTYLLNENSMKFCFDIEFASFLISFFTKKQFYSTSSIFHMKNNQRITCQEIISRKIKFNLYTKISIRMKTFNDFFAIFSKEFHILNDVSCSIVVETNLMKSYNISSNWDQRNLFDFVIIQDTHVIKIKATLFQKLKELTRFIRKLFDFSTKIKSLKVSRKKATNVYVVFFHIIESDHDQNVEISHKSLTKDTYQYSSWFYENSETNSFATRINAMIFDDIINVFLTNFDETSIKIKVEQFLKTLTQNCIDDFIEININVINVLLEQSEIEIKKDDIISHLSIDIDVIKVLLEKSKVEIKKNDIVSDFSITLKIKNLFNRNVDSDVNSTNSFAFETSENEKNLNSDINDHWESKYKKNIRSILMNHKLLFRFNLDQFNDEILMLVSFRDEKNIEKFKQFSYFMSIKNKRAMNEIMNSLVANDQIQKVSFETINLATSSTFVIWRKEKSRVVINFKRINIKLYLNVYSLSKQNTILSFFDESTIFSFIDLIKNFFQQSIDSKNYWKTTFVSQHRDLEWFIVFSMSLNNIFEFFQHRMKKVLKKYLWKFVLVYIDDIIIFFSTLEDHLKHLNEILILLKKSNVILFFFKSHFDYSSIKALRHHVNRLNINIMKKKIKIIKNLRFFVTLKNLKKELNFFDYYRNFVSWYSFIEKSLIKLKTQAFKEVFKKERQKFEWTLKIYLKQTNLNLMRSEYHKNFKKIKSFKICINAWKKLKKQLCNAIIKVFSNFSRSFILYVDDNKKRDFEVTLHQIEANEIKWSILFFFKSLIETEFRYWATELKTTAFVWAFIKLSQYFDDESFTIIIDHFVFKSALQTRTTEKRFARFNEWAMFLFTFLSRMIIIHRFEKNHLNANELSRLVCVNDDESERKTQKIEFVISLSIVANNANSSFLKVVRKIIFKDDVFDKIFQKIKKQMQNSEFSENNMIKYQFYRLNLESNFLYFIEITSSDRLCIFEKLSKNILFHAHDRNAHDEIHRIYDFLRKSAFISKMKKRVKKYVTACSSCQIFKDSIKKSYEKLQFISFFQEFFFEMSLNFIVELLMIIKKNNAFLTITNRFSKYVKLISKIENFSAAAWVERYWKFVYRFWEVFHRIVFNKDSKFTFECWRELFVKCDVKLNFITTYHSFVDEQAKRSNQIVKNVLRCLLIKQYEKCWNNLLSNVELSLNTSANAFSEISSFEILYDVLSKISLLKSITAESNVDAKNFLKQRNRIRQDIMNFLRLAQTRMTIIFDVKHKSFRFKKKMFLKMTKLRKSEYHVFNQSFLSSKKLRSFKIIHKMNSLVYELKLSNFMKNHSIISIIHLKQVKKNSFERTVFTTSSSLTENDEKMFVIEKILKKRSLNDTNELLIKWKDWKKSTWKSEKIIQTNVSKMIKKFR